MTTAIEEFLAAEVEFWREQHRQAVERLDEAHRAITGGASSSMCDIEGSVSPPEPPVGTTFTLDGRVIWRRGVDGWHCDGPTCTECPSSWRDARDWRPQDWNRTVRHLPAETLPAVTS